MIFHLFLVLALFCGSQLCLAVPLDCTFKEEYYWNEEASFYTCMVQTLDNQNNKMVVTEATGVHLIHETNRNVRQLIISNTKTTYLPDGIGKIFSLTSLMVYSTTLKEIQSKNFVGMDDLEYLYLVQNQLKYLDSDSFVTLKRLKKINLGQNQLVALEHNLFVNNLQLDYIWLNKNQINSIGSNLFKHLKKLNYLDLRNNVCVNQIYSEIDEIEELKNDIENCMNPIEEQKLIDEQVELEAEKSRKNVSNPELIELRKENSELKILNVEYEKQESYINLEIQKLIREKDELNATILKYQNDNLEKSQKDSEANEVNLRNLVNQITVLNKDNLNCSCQFENLFQYTCLIEDFQLKNVHQKINQVNGVHASLKSNSDVIDLNITNSEMFYLSNVIFKTFENLQNVSLSNISMKHLYFGDFDGATHVKHLLMDNNQIRFLEDNIFEAAEELEVLSMNSNQIEIVSPKTFKGLSKLKVLSMKDNLIKELHEDTFKDLVKLKALILSSNQLKTLDGKLLRFNTELYRLSMDKNKLEEIDRYLLNFSQSLMIVDFSSNICIDEISTDTNVDNLITSIENKCMNRHEICNRNKLILASNKRKFKENVKFSQSIYYFPSNDYEFSF